jgi:hypothetical protein
MISRWRCVHVKSPVAGKTNTTMGYHIVKKSTNQQAGRPIEKALMSNWSSSNQLEQARDDRQKYQGNCQQFPFSHTQVPAYFSQGHGARGPRNFAVMARGQS